MDGDLGPLSIEEAAAYLYIMPSDIERLLERGELTARRDGRIDAGELDGRLRRELDGIGRGGFSDASRCAVCGGASTDYMTFDPRHPSIGGVVVALCKVHWRDFYNIRGPFFRQLGVQPHLIAYAIRTGQSSGASSHEARPSV